MNENELQLLWQTTNKQLAASIQINEQNLTDITQLKISNLLSSMKPVKIFTLLLGIIWVVVVGSFLIHLFTNAYTNTSVFFLYSLSVQVLLTAVAIGVYLYQLVLINTINYSLPLVYIQETLAKLQISTLQVTRVLFLQLPLWTTFFWSKQFFNTTNIFLLIVPVGITVLFTVLAIWLFINIKIENAHTRWFRLIFTGNEWQPIVQASALLQQLKAFKTN